jgi:hypothetical protein
MQVESDVCSDVGNVCDVGTVPLHLDILVFGLFAEDGAGYSIAFGQQSR